MIFGTKGGCGYQQHSTLTEVEVNVLYYYYLYFMEECLFLQALLFHQLLITQNSPVVVYTNETNTVNTVNYFIINAMSHFLACSQLLLISTVNQINQT